jgi:hypothetical protein
MICPESAFLNFPVKFGINRHFSYKALDLWKNSHVIYPMGKPMAPQLICCKGFAVKYYNFTLYASDLQHLRLLQP